MTGIYIHNITMYFMGFEVFGTGIEEIDSLLVGLVVVIA
jgi:hypothetical protein